MTSTPYHEGELAVQQRAGESHIAERNGVVIRDSIPRGALQFVRQQSLTVVGTRDTEGRLWASILFGNRGFLDPADNGRSLRVLLRAATRQQSDPFWKNITETRRFGMLAVELGSRRRLRMNGRAASIEADQLVLEIEEAYPNCPKYIQRRYVRRLPVKNPSVTNSHREGTSLDPELTALIRTSDTFFVATAHPSRGVDVSHRGGNPGFVKVLDNVTLRIPDYPGNSMFNTLGNLTLNRSAGLAFPDFEGCRVLQLTGTADISWDQADPANETGGTGRFWQFHPASWLETPITDPVAAEFLDYSPFNP